MDGDDVDAALRARPGSTDPTLPARPGSAQPSTDATLPARPGSAQPSTDATLPARPGASDGAPRRAPAAPTIGRYTLERQLGEGGMGVVHLALDPSLERRVALKVLHHDARSSELAERLLREARAMAKLTHPNVVTVFEAGTADGVDYVAMELFDGESLDAWCRAAPRTRRQILDAFTAAGQGLAAAHAAGLVHRDFKPHNVLRSRAGRVAVTDFGLAREVAALESSRASSRRGGAVPVVTSTLTQTGAVMGTPAYMAPEQWAGDDATRASDQFAFCVALWEALAGERPFRAESLEALRAQVQGGQAPSGGDKIPRALRTILRRGLATDPTERWPSMTALLTAIARARRRPRVALAIGGAVVAAAVIALLVVPRGQGAAAAPCPASAYDPARVVSDADQATLAAHQPVAAAAIRPYLDTWRGARIRVCQGPATEREARTACLDALLSRFDGFTRGLLTAVASVPDAGSVNLALRFVEPAVCLAPQPPRLVRFTSPQQRAIMAELMNREAGGTVTEPAALAALVDGDACATAVARSIARLGTPDGEVDVDTMVERCDDDLLRASMALQDARRAIQPHATPLALQAKVDRLAAALDRIPSQRSRATLLGVQAQVAIHIQDWDAAIAAKAAEAAIYADLGDLISRIDAVTTLYDLRKRRPTTSDPALQERELIALRTDAARVLPPGDRRLRDVDTLLADWTYHNRGPAEGHAKFEQLPPVPNRKARRIGGRVVDATGAAVAGATVFVDRRLKGDAISAALALEGSQRTAVTGADGRFEIADAVTEGVAIAEHGDRRSRPRLLADELTLTLEDTSELTGTVELNGVASVKLRIYVEDPEQPDDVAYSLVAMVDPDGQFRLRGVPRRRVRLMLVIDRDQAVHDARELVIDRPVIAGLTLAANPPRTLDVLVRSTVSAPIGGAWVRVLEGSHASGIYATRERAFDAATGQFQWCRAVDAAAQARLGPLARTGDFHAVVRSAPRGVASACALGFPRELSVDLLNQVEAHKDQVEVRCVAIAADATAVVIEVPPMPRLD